MNKIIDGMDLSEYIYQYADLSGTTFKKCDLTDAKFIDCNLTNTEFYQCNLTGTVFENSVGVSTNFYGNYQLIPRVKPEIQVEEDYYY